jgi:hypothetical protein
VCFFFVGLGLGPRNRIDDGFDIGMKDSVRMGGVVGPTNVGPINSRTNMLANFSLKIFVCVCVSFFFYIELKKKLQIKID